jgi:hypothetical protein
MGQVLGDENQRTLPGMGPAPPQPASPTPTTTQQTIIDDPTKQAEAFGIKPAEGGVDAIKQGAELAAGFSGKKPSSTDQNMAGDQS